MALLGRRKVFIQRQHVLQISIHDWHESVPKRWFIPLISPPKYSEPKRLCLFTPELGENSEFLPLVHRRRMCLPENGDLLKMPQNH